MVFRVIFCRLLCNCKLVSRQFWVVLGSVYDILVTRYDLVLSLMFSSVCGIFDHFIAHKTIIVISRATHPKLKG